MPETVARETLTFPVGGMTCAACQSRVQRALQKAPGVSGAAVNLMLQNATVTFDPTIASPDALYSSRSSETRATTPLCRPRTRPSPTSRTIWTGAARPSTATTSLAPS